jgi:hypothetical protein
MCRTIAFAFLWFPLMIRAGAAPGPAEPKELEIYHPTQVGAEWVYQGGKRGLPTTGEATLVIKDVKREDGKAICTIVDKASDKLVSIIEVSERGLLQLANETGKLKSPRCLLKLPYKLNETWEEETANAKGVVRFKVSYAIGKVEKVKVPAGTYEAIRVDIVHTFEKTLFKTTQWYAPKVGLVKEVTGDDDLFRELKSFKPNKD